MTTSERPVLPVSARGDRRAESAMNLWAQARGRVDIGHLGTGLRLGSRALARLPREDLPEQEKAIVRARILVTMADAQVELGLIDEASALLDEAAAVSERIVPAAQASRGVLFARTGRVAQAQEQFDAAVGALSAGRPGANLVRALLWRGMLHMSEARLESAQADSELARHLGEQIGLDAGVVIATHNLGLIRYFSGDLPGALHQMAIAHEAQPGVREGIRSLDRARVLLDAGLIVEAREFADRAETVFAAEHSRVDLADSLLVQAEIDLVARRPTSARSAARRAARSYAGAHHLRGVLAARVLEARAESLVTAVITSAGRRRRAHQDADRDAALAEDLLAAGLSDDARVVRLLEAEALLEVGDVPGAEAAARASAALGAGSGRSRRPRRMPSIATELHTRVVAARLELAHGRRSSGIVHIRRGLDDLAAYQARFGSQDLQSASAVHGRELTRLGLRTALDTRSPAAILQWLERSRAASTRLAAVRPSADGGLARDLSTLRVATYRARAAQLAGEPAGDLERTVDQLRRRVRSRSWAVGGTGAVNRPLTLAAVQRVLAADGSGVSLAAPFRGGGQFHALVITAKTARYRHLGVDFGLEHLLQRMIGDLNVLADHRIMEPLRKVARTSLQKGLRALANKIVDPLLPFVDDGPVVVAAAGSAAIVPWALLPGLSGRAVTVSPSVTAAVAHLGGTQPDHLRGVLAVAGPDVQHGTQEVHAVAASHPDAELLTGAAATGHAVLGAIPAGGVLHIAAHGHHEQENPLFSGVLLADGLLYGYDVAPNPALPAQVVLSSCDVGRTNDRPGGEPLGLVAALLRSGVSTVVAGTSRVSDQVAASVMAAYHQRLRTGDRPAIALASAIKTVAEQDEDPAPFSCFGAGL